MKPAVNQALGAVLSSPHKEDLLWGGVQVSLEEERPLIHVPNPEGCFSFLWGILGLCSLYAFLSLGLS